MKSTRFVKDRRAVADNFFVFIIAIMLVVVLFIAGGRVMNNLFCMNSVSATQSDVERFREIIKRVYAGAEQSLETYELNVPGGGRYCFIAGAVYIDAKCVSEEFPIDNLIVYNTFIDENVRANADDTEDILTSLETDIDRPPEIKICLTPGFYLAKFERTATKVNLKAVYGQRDKDFS